LSSRFQNLYGKSPVSRSSPSHIPPHAGESETLHNPDDDQSLEELLKELQHDEQSTFDHHLSKEEIGLVAEAKHLILISAQKESAQENPGQSEADNDRKETEPGDYNEKVDPNYGSGMDHEAEEVGEAAEADEYLEKVMAELALKRANGEESDDDDSKEEAIEGFQPIMGFPDVPSTLKGVDVPETAESKLSVTPKTAVGSQPPTTLGATPQALHDRFAALSSRLKLPSTPTDLDLPSAPKSLPGGKVAPKPSYSSEQIDSWCIICNDDATVRCSGCDGELYCARCWKEGHVGPDVGYEEKMHKWSKFVKPR
jgi:hypothetical protein